MNSLYKDDLNYLMALDIDWNIFCGKGILITGATGMIGRVLIDVLMAKNESDALNCHIFAMGRSTAKAKQRLKPYWTSEYFSFIEQDVTQPIDIAEAERIDFIVHLASNTHPIAYATDPVGTITTNVIGAKNLLDFAVKRKVGRVAFASSNEIYGENRGDTELFEEEYCGYIDCNTLRAGYPESKRCGEALCQAYIRQHGLDVVIPRFTRSYGPTLLESDSKALSQFIRKATAGENIVLKSQGTQFYSYAYVADSVAGLLFVLAKGACGEAYNIADTAGDVMLKELARKIASYAYTEVVFEAPDQLEKAGYSTATKARLSGEKLKQLGWSMRYDIDTGINRTLQILSEQL